MEIKGTALLAIRDFVKINYKDKYEEWLTLLSNDSRQIYESSIDSTKWYPITVAAVEPTQKTSEMFFMNDVKKAAWEGGRFSAEKALTGIYKIFVKASSPGFIISRAKDIFARYYRPYEMSIAKSGKNDVVLQMIGGEESNELIEYRIGGWIEKAIEISGAKECNVAITKSKCRGDDLTEFTVSWS